MAVQNRSIVVILHWLIEGRSFKGNEGKAVFGIIAILEGNCLFIVIGGDIETVVVFDFITCIMGGRFILWRKKCVEVVYGYMITILKFLLNVVKNSLRITRKVLEI